METINIAHGRLERVTSLSNTYIAHIVRALAQLLTNRKKSATVLCQNVCNMSENRTGISIPRYVCHQATDPHSISRLRTLHRNPKDIDLFHPSSIPHVRRRNSGCGAHYHHADIRNITMGM